MSLLCSVSKFRHAQVRDINLLPELDDRGAQTLSLHAAVIDQEKGGQVQRGQGGREVGGGGRRRWQSATVVAGASEILCAVGGVPRVSAGGPRQWVSERVEEIVEAPHQYHDVVGITEKHNHH